MTAIDIILLLIFIVSAWFGFRKGIIKQLGSLAAIVLAIIACRMFGPQVTDIYMAGHPEYENSAISHYTVSILANAVIYLVAYYAVILVAKLLRMISHAVLLGPLDSIGGAIFSVAKIFLLVSLLLNLYIVCFPSTSLLSKSRLAGGKAVEMTVSYAPWVLGAISPYGHDRTDSPDNKAPEKTSNESTI